jgi:cytoskeleton protein RodZ
MQDHTLVSVGATLRAARESQGRSVGDIADELCIMPSYVQAIENGNLKNLPGTFFYKSFAKQFAQLVSVEAGSLMLDRVLPGESNQDEILQAMPAGAISSYRPPVRSLDPIVVDTNSRYFSGHPMGWSVAGLLAAVLMCAGVYSWWNRVPVQQAAHQAATTQTSLNVEASNDAVSPAAPQIETTAAANSSSKAASADAASAAVPVSTDVSTDLPGVVLDLSATESTWLSITSNGKQIFAGVLRPSESKKLGGMERATLRVGNAAGIEVRWNGKPIGPLGGRGQVRTVQFTPEKVQILSTGGAL